jgi:hypothetical protein
MRGGAGAGVICVLAAAVLGGCASEADDASAPDTGGGPVAYEDHWHTAFGVYVCDAFLPDIREFESPEGIHTHGDGVVHIHPFTEAGAGANATLGLYLAGADVAVGEGELSVGGETYRDGDDCDGEPGRVQVVRWADVRSGADPEDVTSRASDQRFDADGEGYTLAFVPEGVEVPPPPSVDLLDQLSLPDEPEVPPDEAAGNEMPGDGTAGAPGDVPASGGGAVPPPGFRPVLATGPAAAGACGRDAVGGLDGQCYELGTDGPGLDAVATAEARLEDGQHLVALELTDDGIDEFNALAATCFPPTATCPVGRVAIVVDDRVVSAPTVHEAEFAADQISISGEFDEAEAEAIADALTP